MCHLSADLGYFLSIFTSVKVSADVISGSVTLQSVQAILLPQPPKQLELQACLQLTVTVYFEKRLGSFFFNATSLLSYFLLMELKCNAPPEMSKCKVTFLPDSLCPVHEPLQEVTTEAPRSASPLQVIYCTHRKPISFLIGAPVPQSETIHKQWLVSVSTTPRV